MDHTHMATGRADSDSDTSRLPTATRSAPEKRIKKLKNYHLTLKFIFLKLLNMYMTNVNERTFHLRMISIEQNNYMIKGLNRVIHILI